MLLKVRMRIISPKGLLGSLGMLLAAVAATALSPSLYAATTSSTPVTAPAPGATANTLRVTPVRTDITVQPGKSATVEVTVFNLTKGTVLVHPAENDFIAGDESGTPALILDENTFAPTHSLKRFMVPLQNVSIPAGGAVTVKVVINVPKNPQAGGYFGAVRFAPTTPDAGEQVNLSVSVASLILLTVPGNTVESLSLTNFDIQQNGKTGANFSDPHNIAAAIRFLNKGNVQLAPFGQLAVRQGSKIIYEKDFNTTTPQDEVLPDSARKWEVPLSKIGTFGHYTVEATFTYGKNNQTIDISKSFWVIPTSLIIGAIAAVGALIALIGGIWLALRAYRNHILKKYGSGR